MKNEKIKSINLNLKKRLHKFNWKANINYIILGIILVFAAITGFSGILGRKQLAILAQIGYTIILVASLNLTVGFLGELSLGHAAFMCVGAYIGCYFSIMTAGVIPMLPRVIMAMLIGGLVAAVAGFIIGLPTLRLKGDYVAITTLAFGEIVRNVLNNVDAFGGALGMSAPTMDKTQFIVLAFVVAIIIYFLIQNLVNSKHGRAVKAIRDNEIAAKAMGVNVTKYKLIIFVISAFFAGVAGVLYGHNTTLVPTKFDYNYSILMLVMVVLGGMGNLTGSIISAILLTIVDMELGNLLSGDLAGFRYFVYAIILIITMMYTRAPFLEPLRKKLQVSKINNFIRRKIFKQLPLKKVGENIVPDNPTEELSENYDLALNVPTVNADETITMEKRDIKEDSDRKGGNN